MPAQQRQFTGLTPAFCPVAEAHEAPPVKIDWTPACALMRLLWVIGPRPTQVDTQASQVKALDLPGSANPPILFVIVPITADLSAIRPLDNVFHRPDAARGDARKDVNFRHMSVMDCPCCPDDRSHVRDDCVTSCDRRVRSRVASRYRHAVIDDQRRVIGKLIAPGAPIFCIHIPEITCLEAANGLHG